ncbi:MAG: hypothetical protein JWR07_3375 [Nevskia sp.]|nr:hypothetical protein [Nevskia sp.]
MLRPGSLWWLLWWDLRLAWRAFSGKFDRGNKAIGSLRLGFNLLAVLVLLHLFGWSIVTVARAGHPDPPMQLALLSAVLCVALFSATGVALATAVNLLFVRSDLDLLCSTPVPVRNVFAARALSIAVQAIAFPAMMFLPAANIAAVLSGPRWLAAYPMALGIGLVATTSGLALTILLVRLIGPAKARTAALVLSMLLGASFLLGVQSPNLLGSDRQHQLSLGVGNWLRDSPLTTADSWIWLPARAARGEAGPLCLSLIAAALFFAAAAMLLPRGFAFALGRTAGMAEQGGARKRPARRFRPQLWRVMFLKEWRLIYRDPQLLVMLLQQLIAFIPGILILGHRSIGLSAAARQGTLVCFATVVAGVLAATLVWLAVCAEDMPELLACAPRPRGELRRIKLIVVLLPLWLAALALSSWLAWAQAWMFLALVICIAGSSLSMGMFHLWLPTPGSRKDIRRRFRRGSRSLGRSLAGLGIQFGWAGFAWCFASMHLLAAMLVLPIALAGPFYAWLGRNDDEVLSY